MKMRGKALALDAATRGSITTHLSFLLRVPDAGAKAAAFAATLKLG